MKSVSDPKADSSSIIRSISRECLGWASMVVLWRCR